PVPRGGARVRGAAEHPRGAGSGGGAARAEPGARAPAVGAAAVGRGDAHAAVAGDRAQPRLRRGRGGAALRGRGRGTLRLVLHRAARRQGPQPRVCLRGLCQPGGRPARHCSPQRDQGPRPHRGRGLGAVQGRVPGPERRREAGRGGERRRGSGGGGGRGGRRRDGGCGSGRGFRLGSRLWRRCGLGGGGRDVCQAVPERERHAKQRAGLFSYPKGRGRRRRSPRETTHAEKAERRALRSVPARLLRLFRGGKGAAAHAPTRGRGAAQGRRDRHRPPRSRGQENRPRPARGPGPHGVRAGPGVGHGAGAAVPGHAGFRTRAFGTAGDGQGHGAAQGHGFRGVCERAGRGGGGGNR
ncbi:hypothetical protein H632_c3863p0, partial [Helicosporidium sp. ATCC 50920]